LSNDESVAQHVGSILEGLRFQVISTNAIDVAVKELQKSAQSLMVLDSNVGWPGVQRVMDAVSTRPATILLVGSGSQSVYEAAGAEVVLIKPASSDDLEHAIKRLAVQPFIESLPLADECRNHPVAEGKTFAVFGNPQHSSSAVIFQGQ
jgi:DNA-binding NtrC family response regulator